MKECEPEKKTKQKNAFKRHICALYNPFLNPIEIFNLFIFSYAQNHKAIAVAWKRRIIAGLFRSLFQMNE